MGSITTNDYIRFFESLNLDSKLELLSKLTESLKNSYQNEKNDDRSALLSELFGAWKDSDIDEEEILKRTISDREINFD